MTTTPRTAAKYAEIFAEDDHEAIEKMKAFAEQLEKELNEAKERIKRLEEAWDQMFWACNDEDLCAVWCKAKETKP